MKLTRGYSVKICYIFIIKMDNIPIRTSVPFPGVGMKCDVWGLNQKNCYFLVSKWLIYLYIYKLEKNKRLLYFKYVLKLKSLSKKFVSFYKASQLNAFFAFYLVYMIPGVSFLQQEDFYVEKNLPSRRYRGSFIFYFPC